MSDFESIWKSLIAFETIWWIVACVVGLAWALICGFIAEHISNEKGGIKGAFWLGFFLGILGIIIVACVSPSDNDPELDSDWICLTCNTRNPYNSNYCKACGTSKDAPLTVSKTQKPAPSRFEGAYKNENTIIMISGNQFKIYLDDIIINKGTIHINNDKLYLFASSSNKKMTLTAVGKDMLVTLNGKVFKKSL